MARRPTALERAKQKLKDIEARLIVVTSKAVDRDQMQEGRLLALQKEIDLKNLTIADKNLVITRRDETIQQRDSQINHMIRERDTIVRIVDQFTSIQITPLGTTTNNLGTNQSTPAELRLT